MHSTFQRLFLHFTFHVSLLIDDIQMQVFVNQMSHIFLKPKNIFLLISTF